MIILLFVCLFVCLVFCLFVCFFVFPVLIWSLDLEVWLFTYSWLCFVFSE
jgi:hypothetical protein